MSVDLEQLTPKEQYEVLAEAYDLILQPENWCKRYWKCVVYDVAVDGLPKYDEYGAPIQKKDKHGNPMFAYCVEGAINQAVVNVLGWTKAEALGISDDSPGEQRLAGDCPTNILSVNETARELFPGRTTVCQPAMNLNDRPETTHDEILKLLRIKRDEAKQQLSA